MKLFEIAQEYDQILGDMYDDEGNENPQALARLEENNLALEKKSIALASWIKNMEIEKASIAEAKKQIDEAKKNMLARERALENKIDRWHGYIQEQMERRGINEIKCPYFVLKLRKNNPSVDAFDESKVPDDYWVYSRKLDRVKMLSEMKVGVLIPGAKMRQDMRLQIK